MRMILFLLLVLVCERVFLCVLRGEGGVESCFDNGENYDNNEQLYLYRVMHE